MTKIRILLFVVTILIVGGVGLLVTYYARGYRIDSKSLKLSANGLLVIKSDPDGAQVFINGELKTATNTTIPLNPGTYDVSVRKDGYMNWNKRLQIQKEIVTEATATLFKSAPSLSAITFSGVLNPISSNDFSKISYIVPPDPQSTPQDDNSGLWIMDTVNLPLGFSRQPRRVTDGDLTKATWLWSPDDREILLTNKNTVSLLNSANYTSQQQRTNVLAQKDATLSQWQKDKQTRLNAQMDKLPDQMKNILTYDVNAVTFSPDEEMVLYTASSSATIQDNLIPALPGASTQPQQRTIKPNQTYVYDIKEDRNFLVDSDSKDLAIQGGISNAAKRRMFWFPTSRHLVLAENSKITMMDYDSTNKQVIFNGSYVAPFAFSALSQDRILILTNLGADSSSPNLYSLTIK